MIGPLPEPPEGARLPDWLARQAWLRPTAPALLCGETSWSFAELDLRAATVAARLEALEVAPASPVALLAGNGAAYAAVVHGITRRRAILVPLNLRLTPDELVFQLADVGATLLVHDAPRAALAEQLRARLPDLRLASDDSLLARSEGPAAQPAPALSRAPARYVDLGAVHCVIYTSGTTGRPKGAMLTWGNHWWSAVGSVLNLGLQADDRWLAVLPLFHVGGLSILLRSAIYGIPAVVQPGFEPADVNQAIDQQGVTIVSVVSAMLQRMLDQRGDRPYPASLRCVLLGGGPAPAPLLEACRRRGVPVVQTYGLTETASQVATLAPGDAQRKLGSSGKPLLPTELRIFLDGREAGSGQVGEIVVRGPTVTPGYVNRDEATFRALRGGWLRTGDLGYLDDEGYLYVLDRRDDLIVSGGENVYPAEVEAVLQAHPAVAGAAFTAQPDPTWGQIPVAWLEPRPGAAIDEAEILAFCRARLAAYKVPKRVATVAALPRNAAGKLLRRALRQPD